MEIKRVVDDLKRYFLTCRACHDPKFCIVHKRWSFTGLDAALAVLEGKADAAFGLLGLAQQCRLAFVPVMLERFDLLVERRAWFEPPMQRFLGFCGSKTFKDKAKDLQGYDISGFGRIRFNGP